MEEINSEIIWGVCLIIAAVSIHMLIVYLRFDDLIPPPRNEGAYENEYKE